VIKDGLGGIPIQLPTISKLKEKRDSSNKQFRHCFLKEFNAHNVDTPSGRTYVTPDGVFSSVTTFLGALDKDSDWLEKWAEKLGGKDKADIELKRCGDRGTGVHLALEYLVKNTPKPEEAGDYQYMYRQIQTVMNIHVDDIYGLELPLWSKVLKLAGRVDCIARYKGELAIIDFKTSSKTKLVGWITNYFLQTCCYQIMLQELYGLKATKLVIIIAVEGTDTPQVFIRDPKDYYHLLAEKLKEFRSIQEKTKKAENISLFDSF
jgi:hypothetical protein